MMRVFKMKVILLLAFISIFLLSTYAVVTQADELEFQPIPDTMVADAGTGNDALIVNDTIPTSMVAGRSYTVSVTVRNTGSNTWTAASKYRLVAVGYADPFTTSVYKKLNAGDSVAGGQQKAFTFTMTAPSTTGTYTTDWRMQQGGVAWFGPTLKKTVTVILPANDAQIVSDTIPTTMEIGKGYAVSVTVKNTGTNTWTKASRHRLCPVGVSYSWLGLSDGESIKTGEQKTFSFNMTAPGTAGTYTKDWRMQQAGVSWFGQILKKTVTVTLPPNVAQIVSDTIPATMELGKSYTVSVTVKNTGNNTWTAAGNYGLSTVGNSDPFTTMLNLPLDSGDSIASGQSKTFSLTLTAPSTLGTYTTNWQMQQNGVGFGAVLTKNVTITTSDNAQIVTDTVPTTMIPGKTYTVTVTLKNTGTKTWTTANQYGLCAVGDSDPFSSTVFQSLPFGESIAPGQEAIFTLTLTAPGTAGTYTTDWRMRQSGGEWFGATLTRTVTVTATPPEYDAEIISDTIPTEMVAGQSYRVFITVKNTGSKAWEGRKIRLGAVGGSDPFTVNNLLELNADHLPGDTIVFGLTLKASHGGTYTTDWRMYHFTDGERWFGATLAKTVKVTGFPNDAVIISDTFPSTMLAGSSCWVDVTVKNVGSNTWTVADNYGLGNCNSTDPFTKKLFQPLDSSESIAPGQQKTFNFMITAPTRTDYTYYTLWKMKQRFVGLFGEMFSKGVNIIANGTVLTTNSDGNGFTTPAGYQVANGGEPTPITAIPHAGYHFVNWVQVGGDGTAVFKDINAANTAVTVTGGAVTIRANFAPGNLPAVAAGANHSLLLKADGSVYSWGANVDGQLGNGSTVSEKAPVKISALANVTAIAAGQQHSLAIRSDGTVWTWGLNTWGQLGNGNNNSSNIPVQVSSLTEIVAVAGGEGHSLALKRDGTVWAWGRNDHGELGNGANASSNVPVQVDNLNQVIAIACNGTHSLALKSDGTVWAWGSNASGQLGNGTYLDRNIPVQVQGLTSMISIGAGQSHSLAIGSDGHLWAWGLGEKGQLGNGVNSSSNIPVAVMNLTGAVTMVGGDGYSIARMSDGTIWTWGDNSSGQLGNGNQWPNHIPVQINTLTSIVAIAGGSCEGLMLKSDDTVWAWGSNSNGELGNGTNTDSNIPVQVSPADSN